VTIVLRGELEGSFHVKEFGKCILDVREILLKNCLTYWPLKDIVYDPHGRVFLAKTELGL
jgi:hypothetical protein